MTLAEHGLYNILLDTAWEEEPTATIPRDILILYKLTAIRPQILRKFLAKYPRLWSDFAADSRRLVNPRLRAEYEDFLEQCEKKRLAGIASGKARQEKRARVEQPLNNSDSDTDRDIDIKAEELAAAFLSIGFDEPFGQKSFQRVWLRRFSELKADQWLTVVMEATIQECQRKNIGIPPQFYDAKHDVEARENAEAKQRYKRTPL
jgi:uncharacterized protein YdaU (DUF1376 family)